MATEESIREVAEQLGLTMQCQFVPWSQSRNAGEKYPSLNWKVTLIHRGRRFLTTDYMAGMGHCPSYRQGRLTVDQDKAIRRECETGRKQGKFGPAGTKIEPEFADVLHSLASDADALDYGSYEEWASDLGYDQDSRKGESVYRACLEIGLKLRNALGEHGLKQLQEAVRNY